MVSPTTDAIEQCRRVGRITYLRRPILNTPVAVDAALDAACRELLGYLSDIAHATDLDGVLAEISALQRALGGE